MKSFVKTYGPRIAEGTVGVIAIAGGIWTFLAYWLPVSWHGFLLWRSLGEKLLGGVLLIAPLILVNMGLNRFFSSVGQESLLSYVVCRIRGSRATSPAFQKAISFGKVLRWCFFAVLAAIVLIPVMRLRLSPWITEGAEITGVGHEGGYGLLCLTASIRYRGDSAAKVNVIWEIGSLGEEHAKELLGNFVSFQREYLCKPGQTREVSMTFPLPPSPLIGPWVKYRASVTSVRKPILSLDEFLPSTPWLTPVDADAGDPRVWGWEGVRVWRGYGEADVVSQSAWMTVAYRPSFEPSK